jgi:hypothetical protein
MKIEVEVLRAEQSWDLATQQQQNYLVIEVFGIETRVPCTEDQLARAIVESQGGEMAEDEDPGIVEAEPRPAPATFVPPEVGAPRQLAPAVGPPIVQLESAPTRRLAPMQRPRGDDVGIAQG